MATRRMSQWYNDMWTNSRPEVNVLPDLTFLCFIIFVDIIYRMNVLVFIRQCALSRGICV